MLKVDDISSCLLLIQNQRIGHLLIGYKSYNGNVQLQESIVTQIPDFDSNLLSVNKLTKAGYDVNFSKYFI